MMDPTTLQLRSFVAVPLPAAVQTELAEAARTLGRDLPGVKWAKKPENLHVTVKFLGTVVPARLDALGAAVGEALADVAPFAFDVRGFGAFPSPGDAKVLFAGIEDGPGRLAAVAGLVETVAARFGLAREERAFTAHVTVGRSVGRSKEGVDARAALAPFTGHAFGRVTVNEVHVYESRLAATLGESSTYVLRRRAPLGAN